MRWGQVKARYKRSVRVCAVAWSRASTSRSSGDVYLSFHRWTDDLINIVN